MFSKLEALRRFVETAEQGTILAAAESLGISQPALTRTIQLLEKECGAPLFDRHPRALKLTEIGKRSLLHAKHILSESRLAETDLQSIIRGDTGQTRIAAAPVWMSMILPPVIAQFHQQHPRHQFTLQNWHNPEAKAALFGGEVDLICGGFQQMNDLPPFVTRQAFFETELGVLAARDHPLMADSKANLAALLDYPWLTFQNNESYLDVIMQLLRIKTGQTRPPSIQTDSLLSAIRLLHNGPYLTYLPVALAAMDDKALPLAALGTPMTRVRLQSGIVHRRSLATNQAFGAFCKLVRRQIEEIGLTGQSI